MRSRLALILALLTGVSVVAVTEVSSATYTPICVDVQAGQGWNWVAAQFVPGITGTARTRFIDRLRLENEEGAALTAGERICADPSDPAFASTTTTTVVPTTVRPTTTTIRPTTTVPGPTTTVPVPPPSNAVHDIGVGGALPSEATCASRVVSMTENRAGNVAPNATRGTNPNNLYPRVTGNFVGTTDEIIQWAACKWGLDPDWARAQAAVESWWDQNGTPGDGGESFGLLQVRRPFHGSAFEDENAVRSTAYNADYAFENWRRCFEGHPDYAWLNQVERGREYAAGDGLGCMGVWYWGRWYVAAAVGYMDRVTEYYESRIWTSSNFGPARPD